VEANTCSIPVNAGFSVPVRVSRETKPDNTVVRVKGTEIGGKGVVIIAGPCAVESRDQLFRTARSVNSNGARILRGRSI
jgi:3-deoxy-7-phosphoheptulonate synthase